ncbi:HAD family hydrolase [Fulvivirga sedimenti]|uniref:Haloacid dehalogenase-like hydrolase n=1 Tax=Fulvivirga sedimenti TaxID=2879465 RepID=A0A9X1HSR2_9BACT|nr:HAD family hydrolase [Fulvivirga sedimenti]MCA6075329.1 haloacid dehalogenase-like hydrolase [Fulvivirga sedimenti]MCA6076506.1 haloacid dehalogenase-like hydrolase [Fulvivirga sedimenti]MCA6077634.1 haloacid dehalogenase-like hydrolase [Fulvivirga sedimenti]
MLRILFPYIFILLLVSGCGENSATTIETVDPLPSWQGDSRDALIEFVESVTNEGGANYVPPADRIATFDNDGTLWAEQPVYFQLIFAFDRVKQLADQHPEWQGDSLMSAAIRGDVKTVSGFGMGGLLKIVAASHAGMTTTEFEGIVTEWIETARHPVSGRKYTEMVYQPMLELLAYLRANDFKTFIVSGGGIEFMRPWAEAVYGIPPEQVMGSSIKVEWEESGDSFVLRRLPELNFIDDKEGKPVGIHYFIGKRPLAAFGNSDGDLQMLQWTDGREGPSFQMYIHHTDAEREWAYDRDSHIGGLDKGLDIAAEKGWVVVDMKNDWKTIYPPASE